MADASGRKVVATNRKARHDYHVLETIEAGMVLVGSEVKSLRAGQVTIKDAFATIDGGEVWLENLHIAPYTFARNGGHEPDRRRKLLVHRRQIGQLAGKLAEQGLTLIPLSVYFSDGRAKVELGLVRGKRSYDKRQAIKEREQKREMDRARRHRR